MCVRLESTHLQVKAGFGVGVENAPDALGGSHGDGALLRHDLVAVGHFNDLPSARLDELQVSGATLPHPVRLGRGVHLQEEEGSRETGRLTGSEPDAR